MHVGEVFAFPLWGFGPRRLFWPKRAMDPRRSGIAIMAARTRLSCWRPERSYFHHMSAASWKGWRSNFGGGSRDLASGVSRGWYRDAIRTRAGAALRCMGAVAVDEHWIPGPCRLCWTPTFTTCPTCGGNVCEGCRCGVEFCFLCGESDEFF